MEPYWPQQTVTTRESCIAGGDAAKKIEGDIVNELQAWISHNCAQCARDEGFCDHYLFIEAKWVNQKPLDAPAVCVYRETGSLRLTDGVEIRPSEIGEHFVFGKPIERGHLKG